MIFLSVEEENSLKAKKTFLIFSERKDTSSNTTWTFLKNDPSFNSMNPNVFESLIVLNEGNPIETDDWIVLVGNYIVGLGWVYGGYKAYEKAQTGASFCVGALWGRRAGSEFKSTKLRTKEILMCIPCIQLYPMIALPLEAFSGKTMSQVVQEEGLSR